MTGIKWRLTVWIARIVDRDLYPEEYEDGVDR